MSQDDDITGWWSRQRFNYHATLSTVFYPSLEPKAQKPMCSFLVCIYIWRCAALVPCCCWGSSPLCRRCVVGFHPFPVWWHRCPSPQARHAIGSRVLVGRWCKCAGRSHWGWPGDHQVWSGPGNSPASSAPSTHIEHCRRERGGRGFRNTHTHTQPNAITPKHPRIGLIPYRPHCDWCMDNTNYFNPLFGLTVDVG